MAAEEQEDKEEDKERPRRPVAADEVAEVNEEDEDDEEDEEAAKFIMIAGQKALTDTTEPKAVTISGAYEDIYAEVVDKEKKGEKADFVKACSSLPGSAALEPCTRTYRHHGGARACS